jgi:hypothetical protein
MFTSFYVDSAMYAVKDALRQSLDNTLPENWKSPYGYCNLFYWFPKP